MYNIETTELLAEGVRLLTQIKAMLDEPEKVGKLILGVEEAKETLTNKDEIDARYREAIASEKLYGELITETKQTLAKIETQNTALAAREDAVVAKEKEAEIATKKNTQDANANAKQKADLEAMQTELSAKLAVVEQDKVAAAEARRKAQERLNAITSIPTDGPYIDEA